MVEQIIATTVGLTVKNDPKCRTIRKRVFSRVKTAYGDYAKKASSFDRKEMVVGGNVRRLVNRLVRGP